MGMGPLGYGVENMYSDLLAQQSFNNNAPIPRPGQPTNTQPTQMSGPGQSQWNQLNGQLVGDTYLPPGASTVDVGKGWYEVHHGGGRVGTLRPGGNNGRFINDTNWNMPTPGVPALPSSGATGGGMGGGMVQPSPAFAASGPYGQQAQQLAGLLAQPQAPADSGGLLGGPKRGFRIPGGK